MARTQVAIVGAGPAGLLLGHLLHRAEIDSVIVENRSQTYTVERVRAGVLEQGTVDLLKAAGAGERLARQGMRHGGVNLIFQRHRHRIDFEELAGGRAITIYGQNEVLKDLIAARETTGRDLYYEAEEVSISDFEAGRPRLRFRSGGEWREFECDFIAGCDGSHGVSVPSIPEGRVRRFERVHPFAWLGILAKAPPSSDELAYALTERGFALFSMRSAELTRLYLQCEPNERLDRWTDDAIWEELEARLGTTDGWKPNRGEILQRGITDMRSVVVEPMRCGRLYRRAMRRTLYRPQAPRA